MGRLKIAGLIILIIIAPNPTGSAYLTPPIIQHEEVRKYTASLTEGLTQHDPVAIFENNDFSELGFPGLGTREHPYIIEGLRIINNDRCIAIANTDSHFRIRNCDLLGTAMDGVIRLEDATNGIIEDCCIEGGDLGIYIDHCASIDILCNAIAGAVGAGICVLNSDYDITISNNRIFENPTGIYLDQSDSCIINMNRIYCNTMGIHFLEGSDLNEIHSNSIGWNVGPIDGYVEVRNGYDDGTENNWDGNSWCDYRSYNTWYPVGGNAEARDNYPSHLTDLSSPVITTTDIDTVNMGNTSAVLSWNIVEDFPVWFELYQNDIITDAGYITGEIITQPLGVLTRGEYNFTLVIRDGVGYVESLQHHISVVSAPDFSNPFLLSMIISGGIVATIIVILPLDYLRRKRKSVKIDEVENEKEEEVDFDISQLLE